MAIGWYEGSLLHRTKLPPLITTWELVIDSNMNIWSLKIVVSRESK